MGAQLQQKAKIMSSEPAVHGGRRLRIGKYLVLDHLATGSMSAVYRAQDVVTGATVALKVLSLEKAARPELLERFWREASSAARIDHENVVRCLDSGEENGIHFIAFEHVDGVNLHERITTEGKLDVDEARAIVIQAARALGHLHERGIIHRDIKPANFLLVRRGGPTWLVKLIDLGLARDLNLARDGGDPCSQSAVPGVTVGTPDYIAPEQARASFLADARSDLYALGATWYHMLTGQPPFTEGNASDKIRSHLDIEAPDVRDLNPQVPRTTAVIVQRLLMKEPAFRYQSAAELLQALETAEATRSRKVRGRHFWIVLLAGLAVVCLLYWYIVR